MIRSMYSGVSGLKVHQNQMDVIGNNISNVNTTGFKGSRVTFKEMLNQTLSGASSPQEGRGGTNPKQIGLGVQLGSIDTNMGQGSLQSTGKMTDMAIQGNGFFIVNDGSENYYTRAGNIDFDEEGYLVNTANGNRVQGWTADENGEFSGLTVDNMGDIDFDQTMDANASSNITTDGNLDASSAAGDTEIIFDSLGFEHDVNLELEKVSTNEWRLINTNSVDINGNFPTNAGDFPHIINFDSDGIITGGQNLDVTFDPGTGANTQTVTLDFSRLSQFAGDSTADVRTVDGYGEGELKDFTLNEEGVIIGSYDNGYNKDLARIGLANFANPAGLQKAGDTMFSVSNNSGDPQVGAAGVGGRGTISSGTLEMSNVDLAEQFTKMITSQRGFQANSKMITTSDEMLQGLVNMKR